MSLIKENDCVIPFSAKAQLTTVPGYVKTEKTKNNDEDDLKINFWELIAKLNWGQHDQASQPHKIWKEDEWRAITARSREFKRELENRVEDSGFWERNPDIREEKHSGMLWHVIALGHNAYKNVFDDPNFLYGFTDDYQDFSRFLARF